MVDEPEEELDEEDADLEVEPDAEELDDEEGFVVADEDEDDDDVVVADDTEEDEDEESDETPATRTKRRTDEEEDDDEELLSPDDVEADLDRILKDRLVTAEDEDEDEDEEPDERGDTADRLQPKRADEQLCPNCFLLVRATAPRCPVGDDDCPIFR